MDDLIREISLRRARRSLDERPVPLETVERLLTAGTFAPSCSNNQPWRFVAVRDPEQLGKVKRHLSTGNYWAKAAPLIILAVTEPGLDCRLSDHRDYALFDTGMAVGNILLQAMREGLTAHPIAGFDPIGVRGEMGIPDGHILITLIIVGYPRADTSLLNEKHQEQERSVRSRKALGDVASFDDWKERE